MTIIAGPAANNDNATTSMASPLALDVLANDIAAVGTMLDAASVDLDPGLAGQQTSFTIASEGTFMDNGSGIVTFVPTSGFVGTSTASYTVDDNLGATSNAATITVIVDPIPPVAEDDSAVTPLETDVSVPVLINDHDPRGDTLVIHSVTQPVGGSVTFTPQGSVIYTPNTGFFGPDTFMYTIENSNGGTDTATVSVTVGSPASASHPPVAVADASTTPQDTPVTIPVLPNDYDLDADPLSIVAVDTITTQGGAAVVNDNGTPGDPTDDTIDYIPAPGFVGTDTFTYTVDDGNGGADTAVVSVAVTDLVANPVPTAIGDGATTPHDVAVMIDVLANDSHPTPEPLTITTLTDGVHGTV